MIFDLASCSNYSAKCTTNALRILVTVSPFYVVPHITVFKNITQIRFDDAISYHYGLISLVEFGKDNYFTV